MAEEIIVDKNKIYAVKHTTDKAATELALYVDPNFRDFEGICYLTPGVRGHMIDGKLGEKTDTGFTFIPKHFNAGVWEFIEVTYENFKAEFYKLVEAGDELLSQVSNTAELEEFYHRNFPM